MERLFTQFYRRLPLRADCADEHLHLLNAAERARIRRAERTIMTAAVLLSVLGFLAYYLPVYRFPHLFPAIHLSLLGAKIRLPWAELLWCLWLTTVEIYLLVLLNITGVHEIAAAAGLIRSATKLDRAESLLAISLEKKTTEVTRYGIDPFQGLDRRLLFVFNLLLRFRAWLANQAVRYLLRTLVGRYAVRALLDFAGLPIYAAYNAWSVYIVLREARVIIMGETIIALLLPRLPQVPLAPADQELLYDALQFIAVSKRDFHHNHYVLTRELLAHYDIARKESHQLSADFPQRLNAAPAPIGALCRLVILLGFMLDGHISWRERLRLRRLNQQGVLRLSYGELRRYAHDFLHGSGIEAWSEAYLAEMFDELQFVEA